MNQIDGIATYTLAPKSIRALHGSVANNVNHDKPNFCGLGEVRQKFFLFSPYKSPIQ
jgi:hypothetical protein